MSRVPATLATTLACLALAAGCCDIKIPAATIGQFANPEWAKERISADVCYEFPKCTFADPQEEKDFKEAVRQINQIGAALRPALKKGEITAEEFVTYELFLEFFAAQLLAYCENTPAPLNDPAKTLLLAYADKAGMRQAVEGVPSATGANRLRSTTTGIRALQTKVHARAK